MNSHAKAASERSIGAARSAVSVALLGLCALLFVPALLAPSHAQAATGYASAGQIVSGELTGPARAAVDGNTGYLLVADSAKNRVDVFDSIGPGASLLNTAAENQVSNPIGIAIDQSNSDLYVTDPGAGGIRRFTLAEPIPSYPLDGSYAGPAAGSGPEEVGSFASAIAIDPTSGDLLVADRGNDRVSRFDSTGAFVSSFDGSDSPDGSFTHLEDITLSPAGKIFVTDGEAAAGGSSRVLRFSNTGAYEATLRAPASTGDAYLAYVASRDELIVGDARECVFCTTSFHVINPTDGSTIADIPVPAEQITGVASDPDSARIYAVASRGEIFAPPKVEVFAYSWPEVVLDPPGTVTSTSAHLSGTVNPEGAPTEYRFEVSKDGGATWLKSPEPDGSAGGGSSPVSVETDFTVQPNSEYIARLVASNNEGARRVSSTETFTTEMAPPGTETRPATDLGETSAVINGKINPFGLQTTYYFEYGTTTAYGTRVPAGIEATAGNGAAPKSFSRTLVGLNPGTTYHYRLVATNSIGTSEGSDQTFTTVAAGDDQVRGYEQVTPVEKNGNPVQPRIGMQAASDGNALSYTTKAGESSSPITVRAVSIRGTSDWNSGIDTDPPRTVGPNIFFTKATLAVSDDFTRSFVVSNRVLAPGAIEGGANLYLTDIGSSAYQLVGASGATGAYASFVGSYQDNRLAAEAPDLSWVVFYSRPPLVPGAPTDALYRWSEADGLEVVSLLPNGEMSTVYVPGTQIATYPVVSADGSRIYFTATGGLEEGLFLYDGTNGSSTPISVSQVPGDPTTPQPGIFLGTNENGRYAFFVSSAKLTTDALGEAHELYRYDAVDGSLEFLHTRARPEMNVSSGIGAQGDTFYFNSFLQGTEFGNLSVWHQGSVHQVKNGLFMLPYDYASPNGRYLAFSDVLDGTQVIRLYDAETDQVSCASCKPDGTPAPGRLADQAEAYLSNRAVQVVDDEGHVYFDTTARLVAADVNSTTDVYGFHDGSLTLISPGDQAFEAVYGDMSEDGEDVFFTTAQKLVGRDNDQVVDVYDARVGGGLPAQSPPASSGGCVGEDCRVTPAAGVQPLPAGSEAVNGPGNVKVKKRKINCAKGKHKVKVKGKVKCVKAHKAGKSKKGGNR